MSRDRCRPAPRPTLPPANPNQNDARTVSPPVITKNTNDVTETVIDVLDGPNTDAIQLTEAVVTRIVDHNKESAGIIT